MSRQVSIETMLIHNHGNLHKLIPEMVSLHGQEETARRLGVKQAWISRWLNRNNYKQRVIWERAKEVQS